MRVDWDAAILAGGASVRMGRPKALLRVDGEALWRRHYRNLVAAGASRVFCVLAEGGVSDWCDIPVTRDRVSGFGPIAGIEAALSFAKANHVLVLAVDLGRMNEAFLRGLTQGLRLGIGRVPIHGGQLEPLAAVYPKMGLDRVRECIERGDYSLQNCVSGGVAGGWMEGWEVPPILEPALANWNRPEDCPEVFIDLASAGEGGNEVRGGKENGR